MNAIDELITRLDMTEERIFELEEMTTETSKKKKNRNEEQVKQTENSNRHGRYQSKYNSNHFTHQRTKYTNRKRLSEKQDATTGCQKWAVIIKTHVD